VRYTLLFYLHKRFLFINFAETLNKTTMATFEIKDAKKQIILYKGKEYKVVVHWSGKNFWLVDTQTQEKIVRWDYTKYSLYSVHVADTGNYTTAHFMDADIAVKVYDAYVEYYKKLAEVKSSNFKIKVKEEKYSKSDLKVFGEPHKDCIIDITTPMYNRNISLSCSSFKI